MLDAVNGTINKMKRQLPGTDRVRLDAYLDNVREVERRLQIAANSTSVAPAMEIPLGAGENADVRWVLGRPDTFLNTSSDGRLLQLVLEEAAREGATPDAAAMQADAQRLGIEPLFLRDVSDAI